MKPQSEREGYTRSTAWSELRGRLYLRRLLVVPPQDERTAQAASRFRRFLLLALCAAAFLMRALPARTQVASFDDAEHYVLANQSSIEAVYRASLGQAHPFLYLFLLHGWRALGRSMFALRLLDVILGTALVLGAYLWLRFVAGEGAGLAGATLVTFSPALIKVSAELREYSLLLLLMVFALLFLERALDHASWRDLAWFIAFLYLAVITDYSALWFCLVLGGYASCRLWRGRTSPLLRRAWVGSQLGLVAVYAFFYRTHLSLLRNSPLADFAERAWSPEFYSPARGTFTRFVVSHTGALFQYLFGNFRVGIFALLLFVIGCIFASREHAPESGHGRAFQILLVLPLPLAWAASFAHLFPFGGTRHILYLVPIIFTGVVNGIVVIARWLSGAVTDANAARTTRIWSALVIASALAVFANRHVWHSNVMPRDQREVYLKQAVAFARAHIPQGSLILVGRGSAQIFAYYLDPVSDFRGEPFSFDFLATAKPQPNWEFSELERGGYRIVSWREPNINSVNVLLPMISDFERVYHLRPSDSAWLFDIHGAPTYAALRASFAGALVDGAELGPYAAFMKIRADILNGRPSALTRNSKAIGEFTGSSDFHWASGSHFGLP